MPPSASGFPTRLQELSAAQRATLTRIAGQRDGVLHRELPACDLVTLLRSYLVRFSSPDVVEATARGRQVLEGHSSGQPPSASASASESESAS